jgi:hypothetical protein
MSSKTSENLMDIVESLACHHRFTLCHFLGTPYWKIFQKLYLSLEFPEFLNPKKIPQICGENWAILEKLRDSANSKPKFHSFQQSKSLFFCHHGLRPYVIFVSLICSYHSNEWFGLFEYIGSILITFESNYLADQNRSME